MGGLESGFRRGEHEGKPYWGNVSEKPFSKAIVEVATHHGIRSQKNLACRLGVSTATVSAWARGAWFMDVDDFSAFLDNFPPPQDEQREILVDEFARRLQKHIKKEPEGVSVIPQEREYSYGETGMLTGPVPVSKERVRQIKNILGLSLPITDTKLEAIKAYRDNPQPRGKHGKKQHSSTAA